MHVLRKDIDECNYRLDFMIHLTIWSNGNIWLLISDGISLRLSLTSNYIVRLLPVLFRVRASVR